MLYLRRGPSLLAWSAVAWMLVIAVILAAGVGLTKPRTAGAAVCGPGQVIRTGVAGGAFYPVDGKAYFEPSVTPNWSAVDLATSASSTLALTTDRLSAIDEAGHRFFTTANGSPFAGPGVMKVFDTTTDSVVTSAPILHAGPNQFAQFPSGRRGAYDAVRGVLFFVFLARQAPGGQTLSYTLERYEVASGTFTILATLNPGSFPPSIAVDAGTGIVWSFHRSNSTTRVLRGHNPVTGAQVRPDIDLTPANIGFEVDRIIGADAGVATVHSAAPGLGPVGLATVDLTTGAVTAPSATWPALFGETFASPTRVIGLTSTVTQLREINTTTGALASVIGVPASTTTGEPGWVHTAWQGGSRPLLATYRSWPEDTATLLSFPDPASCSFETLAPSVAHVAPVSGATVATGANATLDLTCADPSGIVYCAASVNNPQGMGEPAVLDGGLLPTSMEGTYRIAEIVAIDGFGNRTIRSFSQDPSFDVTYTVAAAPADSTAPAITLTTPSEGASYTLGQVVNAAYGCQDEAGGSGLATCAGSVANGAAIDTATAGSKTFTVNATDVAGNPGSASHTYDVLAGNASGTFSGGQTVTTDPGALGANPAVPLQTSLALPGPLGPTNVSIAPQPTTAGASGFEFFGTEVVIDADGAVASAASPFVVTFTVDKSLLDGPPAVAPADVQIFRDGTLVSGCTDFSAAIPDPCVASRSIGPGGDGIYVVRTTHFSTFSFARFDWTLSGLFAPVDNLPVVNTVSAGRAVPVKFSLGGNRGLDVFATGFPTVQPYSCETNQPLDAIEETVSAEGSSLTYDAASGRYTYVWKTIKSWTGCRELTLRFRDGSIVKAHFKFM